jgi:hypothetical protein
MCLLHTKNMCAAEIHYKLSIVYGKNITNDVTVRQWYKVFEDGKQMFMMKSEVGVHL